MHVDLLSTTKGSPKIIHGTENGKKTACGINLTKPENIGMFTNAGQMNDVVQMTCEKCKTVIAKHLIRESNKEFAAQLKEEQRQLKRERAAAKHHTEAAVPPPVSSAPGSGSSDGYVPPSMRKQTPPPPRAVDTTSPIPAPAPMPSPVSSAPNDVLSQFAVPSVPSSLPSMNQPASVPAAQSADDVLAQFAVPSVPTSLPSMNQPASVPVAQSADDVLAQFAVPSVPSVPDIPDVPSVSPVSDSVDDVLSQFTVPSAPKPSIVSGSSVNQDDILAQFASMQPNIRPYDDRNDDISSDVSEQASTLDDLLILPAGQQNHSDLSSLPDIANVPTSIPTDSIGGMVQSAIPELNVPQAPPAPPIPAMPVPPSQQTAAVSTLPQNMSQIPAQQQFNPFAVPTAPKAVSPSAPMPLFVGYSADGRQLFQTYDEVGNPIPINEPVYSTPPEQKGNDLAIRVAAMASNASMRGNAPIMDMDEIMASMGIADPSKPKKEEGKAINFTEYKIPQEKDRKKKPVSRPASAIASPVPDGPVSAAEAKRRKKVDKINKEFEKQLRSRGIDPKTGGIMIDPRK